MTVEAETRTHRVLMMLVDISGYTKFMVEHEKELRHSQTIVKELLETLIHEVDVPLRLSSIEGDALFLYAIRSGDEGVWARRGSNLAHRLLSLFTVFAQRMVEIVAYSVCGCDACRKVGDMKLKIVAHSGEAIFTNVGEYPTLSGVDVITVHRLAKNSTSGDRAQYMLMTETAYRDLGEPEGPEFIEGVEHLDTGDFKVFVFTPHVEVRTDDEFIRSRFSDDNAAVQILRDEISQEYTNVADNPERGYHFNTGRIALATNEYEDSWLEGIDEAAVASFSGTGNPFSMGLPMDGEYVVDVGSGAGVDSTIAAHAVGPAGHVIGVEMTGAMIDKARDAASRSGLDNLEFRSGYAESLPVPDGWADLVISNGALNLSPEKDRVFGEIFRVLRRGGRIQVGDITVDKPIPDGAKRDIDLWTN